MARRAILLFDGHCGFCSSWVRRIHRLDRAGLFGFAAQQTPRGQALLLGAGLPGEPGSVVVLPAGVEGAERDGAAPPLLRSDAAIYVAARLGFPYSLARFGRALPQGLRDGMYDFVARHRYRIWGRSEACFMPDEALRARFDDDAPARP